MLLKISNRPAHRPMRDVQLIGRFGKAQVPGSGLEAWQGVQRRQPAGHGEHLHG